MEPSEIPPESESGTTRGKRLSEAESQPREWLEREKWLQQQELELETMKKRADEAFIIEPSKKCLLGELQECELKLQKWRKCHEWELERERMKKRAEEASIMGLLEIPQSEIMPEEPSKESIQAHLSKVNLPLPSVLFRQPQIREILDSSQRAILDPSSPKLALYIIGASGSGKSHCTNHLIQHWMNLGDALKNLNYQLHIVFINFSYDLVQPNDIYKKIGGSHCRTSEQFNEFLKREKGKNMRIIIAEDLDRCLDDNWQGLLVELCRLTTRESFLLVGLGRKMLDVEFEGEQLIDVIPFPSYEREELTEILRQNIQGREMIFEPNALLVLEEKFQNNHGYLRVLESICTLAIEKAKDLQKNQVELDDIRSACDTIEGGLKNISRRTKPICFRLLYKAVVTVLYEKRSHVVSLNDLHNTYQRMCEEANTKPLTDKQIRAICSRFNGSVRVAGYGTLCKKVSF